jgi:hypothetical protein
MSELTSAPILIRVDLTADELKALKKIAIDEGKSLRALAGEILRERLAT